MEIFRKCEYFYGPDNASIKQMTLCNIETGSVLSEAERISLKIDEPLVAYVGVVSMIQMVATPIGFSQMPAELPFLIEASSLKEAFAKFPQMVEEIQKDIHEQEEEMVENLKKMKEEKDSSKLYIPSAEESQQINSFKPRLVT
jgi:hypothetical protein